MPRDRARAMRSVNPAFIPRNHRVEQALEAAIEREDFAPFAELLEVLSRPYEDQEGFESYAGSAAGARARSPDILRDLTKVGRALSGASDPFHRMGESGA